jgi:hypothetical protein
VAPPIPAAHVMNFTWLYVAAIYAAAIALARRAGVQLPWRIAIFFFALVLVLFFAPLTTDTINIPVDYIQKLPPWSELNPNAKPANPWQNDVALQLVPWAHQVREQWKSGRIPLWNPNAGSGYPLLANAQSAATSPLRLLALPLSLGRSFTAEAAWKILIALTFTFLYCARRGYSPEACAIGAICFGFSGFIMVWLHYPHATVACFAPALLYAIDLLAERVTFGRFLFIVAIWWAILNGGHPETAAHCCFLAMLAIGWIAVVERPGLRFIASSFGSVFVATLLAAPLLIVFFETVTKSQRFAALKASPHPKGAFADWASTIAMLEPHFFGAIPHEQPWGPAIPETICGFAGTFAVASGFAVLLYVMGNRRWRSREAFFVFATIITIAIIYSWPGFTQLFDLVFHLAANTRLRFILVLMLSLQAAAAVDLLQRSHRRPYILGIVCAAALVLSMMSFDFPSAAHRSAALLSLIPSFIVLLIALLPLPSGEGGPERSEGPGEGLAPHPPLRGTFSRREKDTLLLLIVAVTAELWNAFHDWNPALPSSALYPETPQIRKLIELKKDAREPFRIAGYGATLFPNTAAMYGLEDIRTNDPIAGSRYLGLLNLNTGLNTSEYFMQWYNTETRLLDYLNVRYFVTFPGAMMRDWRFKLIYDGADGRIFENADVLPRFFPVDAVILEFKPSEFIRRLQRHEDWQHTAILNDLKVENDQMRNDFLAPRPPNAPRTTLRLASSDPTVYTMHVVAPRYTLVVSSIPWWPGWKVERNGRRADPIRVNGAFLGFAAPPGESDVRVWYAPTPWSLFILPGSLRRPV